MSTIFGIPIRKVDVELGNDDGIYDYIDQTFFEDIWFRGSNCRWLNPLGPLLPDDTRVYALDNGQQGIYTIGDIKKFIEQIKNEIT